MGVVGCQANRPFGIDGESFENPKYLDKLVDTVVRIPRDGEQGLHGNVNTVYAAS